MNEINVEVLTRKISTWGMKSICIRKKKRKSDISVTCDYRCIKLEEGKNDQRERDWLKAVFQFNKMC